MNKKAMRKILSFVLTVLLVMTSVTPSFAAVSHYVVAKDGVKYQYAQKDLIESYYGDKELYNDYLSGELEALLDDKNGYIKAEDVFKYIASTEEVNVNTFTESDDAEAIEIGTVIELDADGNPIDEIQEFIASDFNYSYSQYKPVMQSERDIFVITGFTKKGLEKSKINGELIVPKTVEVEENGVKVTKSVEGIARDAFKNITLEMVEFPETIGEYDFVINASAFANCGLEEVVFNEGIRAIKESAFTDNNLNEVYFPSTTLTLGNNSFAHNSISELVFSDEVKAIQIDNYSFYDNALEEVHLPYSIFKFQGYVFKGNPGTEALPVSELDDKDPEGTGVVELYTRNPIHLTSDTYIAKSKYHNIVNVAKEIDRTVLYATIHKAKALELSDYSEEDAHDLLDELYATMDIFEDEKSTQEAIDSSNASLRAAIDRLKGSGVDKSDLRELVSQAKGYSSELYTKETFTVLTLAIEKAENLLSDLTATDEVIEEAKGAINDAVSTLVVKSNLVFTKEDFTYEGNILTGFSARGEVKFKRNKNVVLPDQAIDGTTIEVIGPSAFENTEADMGSDVVTPIGGIESIKFPSQLKRIESLAFKFNCLEEVEFPSTLEYVGNLAFNGNLLKSVHLPDSVVELGFGTFSLNRITEVELSPNLKEISNGAFSRNIYLDKIALHEGLTRIGQAAFIGCPLKTIEIPSTVKTIGRLAFSSSRLESVHIPSNVEVIEADAFKQNTKFRTLREVTFEEGLKSIGENAFMDGMISEVTLPYSLEALHDKAFQGNINVDKEAVIVKLYTTNEKHLVYETEKSKAHQIIIFESQVSDFEVDETGIITAYTGNETEVIIPARVKGITVVGIGEKVFYKKGVTLVKVPDAVTTIGEKAFYGNDLESIDLPEALVNIEKQAFYGNDLNALTLPNSIETIGYGAFSKNKITKLILPEGLKVIENGAFMMNALTEVTIPGSVEVVPTFSFAMNPNLRNLVLEEGIKEISMNAFTKSGALSGEIKLPSTLEHIYGSSFKDTGVTSYYVKGGKGSSLLEVHSTTATELKGVRLESPNKEAYIVFNASCEDVTEFEVDLGTLDCSDGIDNLQAYLVDKVFVKESAYHVNKQDITGKSDIVIIADINWDLENVDLSNGEAVIFGTAIDFTAEDMESKGVDYTVPNLSGSTAENTYKLTITVSEEEESDFEIDENGVITTYTGAETDVVIPSKVSDVAVKAIGSKVFMGKGITSVQIPEGVESIGLGSFIKNKLTSITLPNSVKTIETLAFANNKELVEIKLNEGLEKIEKRAFFNTPLQEATVIIPSTLMSIGDSAFLGQNIEKMIVKGDEDSAIIQFGFPIGSNGLNIELESPKKHAEFLWNSFGCGDNENHVDLGTIEVTADTIEALESALESEVNAKIIGIYKAENSTDEDIRVAKTIPWDLSQVDMSQETIRLNQKISLKNEQFPEKEGYETPTPSICTANNYYALAIELSKKQSSDFEIDENGVITSYTGTETAVVIPSEINGVDVLGIGEKAFYRKSITSVKIPDTVTTIGEKAFYGNDLVSIDLPEVLVNIEKQSFAGNDLATLTLPSLVETIGYGAFSKNKISTLNLPDGLKTIDNGAFMMNALTEVTIPGSVEVVPTFSFAMNPNLNKLTLEEGIKEVSMNAFTKSGALSGEVTLPSTLEHIYGSSFKDTGVTGYYVKGDKDSSLLEVHSTTANNLKSMRFESPSKEAYIVFNASGDVEEFLVDLGTLHFTEGADNFKGYLEDNIFVKESAYHVNKNDSTGKSDIVVLAGIDWDLENVNVTTGAAVIFGTAKDFTEEDLESKGVDYTPPNLSGSEVKNTYKITIVLDKEEETAVVSDFKFDEIAVVVDKYFYDQVASNGQYLSKELRNGNSVE